MIEQQIVEHRLIPAGLHLRRQRREVLVVAPVHIGHVQHKELPRVIRGRYTHSELLAMNGGMRFRPSEALTNLGSTSEAEHVGLQIDHPDPMAALRSRGIDARLAWHGDHDQDAPVLVTSDQANLMRLEDWLGLEMT